MVWTGKYAGGDDGTGESVAEEVDGILKALRAGDWWTSGLLCCLRVCLWVCSSGLARSWPCYLELQLGDRE